MKKDGFYAERIKPVVVMAVITIICIAIISGIYLATLDTVTANNGLFQKKAVLYAGGVEVPESNAAVNELYSQRVSEQNGIFIIKGSDGNPDAYAFIISGPGLWGTIEAVTAFEPDFKTFAGVEFTDQNETPGLGARITETWFKEQLRGKTGPLTMVPEGSPTTDTEIDAITGASRTSGYVLDIFNRAVEKAVEIEKEVM